MLININFKKVLLLLMVIFLIGFFFNKQEYFKNVQAQNIYLDDIVVNELVDSKINIPPQFLKYDNKFQLPIDYQYELLEYIKNNSQINNSDIFEFYSSPYNIYFFEFNPNQFNFIFFIDVKNKQNFKIETIQISLISSTKNELKDIQFISFNKIEHPALEIKPYHIDMNVFKISNSLGIM